MRQRSKRFVELYRLCWNTHCRTICGKRLVNHSSGSHSGICSDSGLVDNLHASTTIDALRATLAGGSSRPLQSLASSQSLQRTYFQNLNIVPPQLNPTPNPLTITFIPFWMVPSSMHFFNPIKTVEETVLPVSAKSI